MAIGYIGSTQITDDNEILDALISNTLTRLESDDVITVGDYAFYYCTSLTSVSFPAATSIGSYAFYGCSSLTSVSFPAATSIGSYAFNGCTGLTAIGSDAFPLVTSIGSSAFRECTGLTTIDSDVFPLVTSIGSKVFDGCTGLTSVYFSSLTTLDLYAFQGCTSLTTVVLPAVTTITRSTNGAFTAFKDCSALTNVILGDYTHSITWSTIATDYTFSGNTIGTTSVNLYFRSSSVLSTKCNFSACANIYVASSLVDQFKAKSGWSTYASVISADPDE